MGNPAQMSGAGADQGDAQGSPQGGGMAIILALQADGSIQVFVQGDGDDPAADSGGPAAAGQDGGGGGGDGDGGQAQVFDNIDDALAAVKQIAQQALGEEPGADASDGNAPLAPADAKSLWNKLAAKKDAQRGAM